MNKKGIERSGAPKTIEAGRIIKYAAVGALSFLGPGDVPASFGKAPVEPIQSEQTMEPPKTIAQAEKQKWPERTEAQTIEQSPTTKGLVSTDPMTKFQWSTVNMVHPDGTITYLECRPGACNGDVIKIPISLRQPKSKSPLRSVRQRAEQSDLIPGLVSFDKQLGRAIVSINIEMSDQKVNIQCPLEGGRCMWGVIPEPIK